METAVALGFRFAMYAMFGLCMETSFAVHGIDLALGTPVPRRVPKKYLEGFVSMTMVPLHGLGVLFLFEPGREVISEFHVLLRFGLYAVGLTTAEAAYGWLCHKTLGFYSWDYYARSPYKVFKQGYTLWTLVPLWGLAGLVLEPYTDLMRFLSPYVVRFFLG